MPSWRGSSRTATASWKRSGSSSSTGVRITGLARSCGFQTGANGLHLREAGGLDAFRSLDRSCIELTVSDIEISMYDRAC
jgi:hypothetical protein